MPLVLGGSVLAGIAATPVPVTWLLALGGWIATGAIVALLLRKNGEAPATFAAALLAWPLFLSLLGVARQRGGPYAERIQRAFAALGVALRESGERDPGDLESLRVALLRADERVLRVEALLEEEKRSNLENVDLGPLERAGRHAREEIEAVLGELARIRIQIGVVTLSSQGAPVGDALRDLVARLNALEEVGRE